MMRRYDFCQICHGINKLRCLFCHMNIAEYRKLGKQQAMQVEHNLYLKKTWEKLKKYSMITTGNFPLDEELRRMWGHWLGKMTAAMRYALDIMRGDQYPEYLRGKDLGKDIDSILEKMTKGEINNLLEKEE